MYSLSHYRFLSRSSFHGKLMYYSFCRPFSTAVPENPPPQNTFLVDYLTNSFGFSTEAAMAAFIRCKKIGYRINTLEKPQSVLEFLKQNGFNEAHIKYLISRQPELLGCKLEKTLKPKVHLLQDLGFSGPALADLVVSNPDILKRHRDYHIKPTIDFLRTILRSDQDVVKAIKRYSRLLCYDWKKNLTPNLELLRQCGVSDSQISWVLSFQAFILGHSPYAFEQVIARVKQAGIRCGSTAFIRGVCTFARLNETELMEKFNIFKSFGWSEEDILVGFRRTPFFLLYSKSAIGIKMEFFLNELGYQPSEIAHRSMLFTFSLEKRLIPRNKVLKILKSRGLLKGKQDILTIMFFSEKKFLKEYVLQHIDKAPELQQAYTDFMDDELREKKMGEEISFVSL